MSITVTMDRFGGNIDKWVYAFKYFVRHTHSLVYPSLLGLEGLRHYVDGFPFFADCIEQAVSEPTVRVDNETGEATVNPGLDFQPGGFTIVGLFDCRDQETCVPGTGPNGLGRNPGAYLSQRAVYSGYKKHHGVKNLTVQLANGLSFLFTPVSARR